MGYDPDQVDKARKNALAFKRKKRRAAGDRRKTSANRFNDMPAHERLCDWNQTVTASQNKDGVVTLTCPCGHKTMMRIDVCNDIYPDGLTKHNETHPPR